MEVFLGILFSVLIAFGVLLVFIPLLPALFYMLAMTVLFALIGKFSVITFSNLLVLGFIVVLSFFVDMLAGLVGAKWGGASKKALAYGMCGLFLGLIIFPPFGGILGLFVGVLVAELGSGKRPDLALRVASGSAIGAVTGMIINFFLALSYFILFLIYLIY